MRAGRLSVAYLHFCSLILLVAFLAPITAADTLERPPSVPWPIKPYAVLLVVESWNDPSSLLVDHLKDEFQPLAALLKAWSVPFDIFRLDQQHLDSSQWQL